MRIVSSDKEADCPYERGMVVYYGSEKTLAFTMNNLNASMLMEDVSEERAVEIMEEIRTAYKLGRTCYECPEE